MISRLALSACALTFVSGCVTPQTMATHNQPIETGVAATTSAPTLVRVSANTNGKAKTPLCNTGRTPLVIFDVGSSGIDVKFACRIGVSNSDNDFHAEWATVNFPKIDIQAASALQNRRQAFSRSFIRRASRTFGSACNEISELLENYSEFPSGEFNYRGAATHAYRIAANGAAIVAAFATECANNNGTGSIAVLSHQEEGEAEYRGVANDLATNNIIQFSDIAAVWGAGSNSMQITAAEAATNGHTFHVVEGGWASQTFRKLVITQIQQENVRLKKTPNPISFDEAVRAIYIAKTGAEIELKQSAFVQSAINNAYSAGNGAIYAVGGTILHLRRGETEDERADLAVKLGEKIGKRDDELGRFPTDQVSNLSLIYGYMDGAGIKKYKSLDAGVPDGIAVLSNSSWQNVVN
ncbi:MAG: hypothetical protein AAF936_08100 [Pseudomonadota bacterium]